MNHENFMRWVENQLLPNLPKKCALIVDNASYHNVQVSKSPSLTTRKADMVAWLAEKHIPYESNATKPELYELIKRHKPDHIRYKLDAKLEEHGHIVLRLPPYHPELNPIEKIWAQVKRNVASRNTTFKLSNVENLTREEFGNVTVEDWAAICLFLCYIRQSVSFEMS